MQVHLEFYFLLTGGTSSTAYGFTGEQYSAETQMLYLRARYYNPADGRFLSRDTWSGNAKRPASFNLWMYSYANPTRWSDPSGMSPEINPNCHKWPTYSLGLGNLQELCYQANWDDNMRDWSLVNQVPNEQLDAREAIYRSIISASLSAYSITKELGFLYAARNFEHFLDGTGTRIAYELSSKENVFFTSDPGIVRATRSLLPSMIGAGGDEPELVLPLLYLFLEQDVGPRISKGLFEIPYAYKVGGENITYFSSDAQKYGRVPRPRAESYWAAFGHVIINGGFSAKAKYSCTFNGYLINYQAGYHINDVYEWFEEKNTPVPFPMTEDVFIPHLWAISLTKANPPRARNFEYTIDWKENGTIFTNDFDTYTAAMQWHFYLP